MCCSMSAPPPARPTASPPPLPYRSRTVRSSAPWTHLTLTRRRGLPWRRASSMRSAKPTAVALQGASSMASSPNPSLPPVPGYSRTRTDALREALATRVVVADGAMGTMLQAQDPTLEDFENLEGCNEILNLTRPDIVRSVHEEYFAVGVDCVETNTFGANHAALAEYDIAERVFELSEVGRPHRPRGRRRVHRLDRAAALGARLHGPRHQAADPRPRPVHPAARRLPAERGGHDRRRRRRAARGDHPGPAADQGVGPRRPPGPGSPRRRPAADRLGDRRDHRHHAARLGDRRRAHRARAARHRHDRPELRHRARRDERAPALSGPPLPRPAVLHAERGPARSSARTAPTTR